MMLVFVDLISLLVEEVRSDSEVDNFDTLKSHRDVDQKT